jgi:hypothetical protein
MPQTPPTVFTATEMQQKTGQIIRRCFRDKENFVIERDGLPVIAIIPIELFNIFRKQNTDGREDG